MKTSDGEFEQIVRRAFQRDEPVGRPGDEFERQIVASLPDRRHWAFPIVFMRTLGAVSIAAVVLIVGAVTIGRPSSNGGAGASTTLPATAESRSASVASPAASLLNGKMWDLAFDYPASWALAGGAEPTAFYGSSLKALGSVGTQPALETCRYPTPAPGFSGHLDQVCATTWDPSAAVQVRFEWDDRDEAWSAWKAISGEAPADDGLTVAGLPARMATSTDGHVPGSDEVISGANTITVWDVASRDRISWSFRITAVLRGSNVETLRTQVDAMMASATFVPAIEPLADSPAMRAEALRAGVAQVRAQADGTPASGNGRPSPVDNPDMSAACFSDVPDTTTEAVVNGTVFIAHRLSQPLKVRCTSQIEPTPFQLWKMTLRYDWDAGAGHAAGSASLVVVLSPDPTSGFGGDMFGAADMPYLQALPPNNPPG
jgi:hypothetical protein